MDIQGLKDKILQLAIQGKLVEQDKNDEPASVLVQRIKEERDKLVKEKKIKKPKPLPEITDEEKPFEIPDSWEWVRLGEVANNHDSKRKPVSVKNRDNLEKIYDYYGATGAIDKVNDFIFDGLYLLIGEDGGNFFNDKDVAFIVQGKFWANNHVHVLDCYSEILTKYIKNVLNSINFGDRELITGIAVPKLNQTNLNNILIPLPPLAEQKRIVEKVGQLFALIDELNSNKEDLLEVINLTRNQVLQEAIQGKLVEQSPEDEPASVLIQRIKEERDKLVKEGKIKKQKPLPEITDEEKPFEIPDSWEWVRINDICNVKGGKRIPKGYTFSDGKTEHVYLRVTDMKCGTILDGDIKYISEEVYDIIKNYLISSDDLYITIAGTIGAVGKIPLKYNNMNLTENASKLSFYKKLECDLDYIKYSIESNLVQNQFKDKVNKMAQPKLALKEIESTIIPLPPLAEQKRIVEKVDIIMDMLDELEKTIME